MTQQQLFEEPFIPKDDADEIDSFSELSYIPDKELIVLYIPNGKLSEYQYQLNDDCYVLSLIQFNEISMIDRHKYRALYALKHKDDICTKRFYFHPAKVVEYIDDDIGFRSRVIDYNEKVSQLYDSKCAKLVPLFQVL